ncbi:unnamed protein product [Vitrella brassicaformis CCMP3155]|uniref:Uncharacterized protein n=2 Tax=Vitrella brassicaformis TaxID=1169539 RepID=A0A0G4F680_VITBC|nr:unnamed protein product [Vitrella brassicaformis CCMP3155]|eukprot:CEM07608.1 unnamed protein product [Vitrella brassicaformis CCMP3155]
MSSQALSTVPESPLPSLPSPDTSHAPGPSSLSQTAAEQMGHAPPSFDEIKASRREAKMRDFRQFLVDKGVVEALVKLLIGLQESEVAPEDPRKLVRKCFGEYRDPLWDVIEELRASSASFREQNGELETKLTQLEQDVSHAIRHRACCRLWRAIATDKDTLKESVVGKDIVMRLTADKKFPRGMDVTPHTLNKDMFVDFAMGMDEALRTDLLAILYPEGEKGPLTTEIPFKGKNDDPTLNQFLDALSAYSPPPPPA